MKPYKILMFFNQGSTNDPNFVEKIIKETTNDYQLII